MLINMETALSPNGTYDEVRLLRGIFERGLEGLTPDVVPVAAAQISAIAGSLKAAAYMSMGPCSRSTAAVSCSL